MKYQPSVAITINPKRDEETAKMPAEKITENTPPVKAFPYPFDLIPPTFIGEIYWLFIILVWVTAIFVCVSFTVWVFQIGPEGISDKNVLLVYGPHTVCVCSVLALCCALIILWRNPAAPYGYCISFVYSLMPAFLGLTLCCGLFFFSVKGGMLASLVSLAILWSLAWYVHNTKRDLRIVGYFVLGWTPLYVMVIIMLVRGAPLATLFGFMWMVYMGGMIMFQLYIQLHCPLNGLNPMVYACSLYFLVMLFYLGTIVCLYDWLP
ncbi:membrane protein A38 [Aotine betaherpesvirus 1]|uniref:Membrane protein A38 n=1 Tax=Aotine betaherpesvirus 1 TaxID=50290 RepID=G8XUL6_9BETA|nr:membrane protein A38 [Aotine betaherpesvirus 1]AEV80858.1 membrane protein A38 [Aotine betaherpesvirus 1]